MVTRRKDSLAYFETRDSNAVLDRRKKSILQLDELVLPPKYQATTAQGPLLRPVTRMPFWIGRRKSKHQIKKHHGIKLCLPNPKLQLHHALLQRQPFTILHCA